MDKELHTPKMDIGFWKSCDEMDFCQLFVNIIRYLMIHQNWETMLKVLQILGGLSNSKVSNLES